jgi:hypothetical protein
MLFFVVSQDALKAGNPNKSKDLQRIRTFIDQITQEYDSIILGDLDFLHKQRKLMHATVDISNNDDS